MAARTRAQEEAAARALEEEEREAQRAAQEAAQADPDRPDYILPERWAEIRATALANSLYNRTDPKGAKPRDPDPFDGTDSSKLDDFLFQCDLIFNWYAKTYTQSRPKILYALQYLKGTAQRHFRTAFTKPVDQQPAYLSDWEEFQAELKRNFGELNERDTATAKLLHIRMEEHHHVSKFRVIFDELASRAQFDPTALHPIFYNALADRIKDRIMDVGKAATYTDLVEQALTIDMRYWERKQEVSRSNRSNRSTSTKDSPSDSKSTTSSNSKPNGNSKSDSTSTSTATQNNSTTTNNNNNRQRNSQNSSTRSNQPNQASTSRNTNRPNLEGKLTPTGQLTDAEKQRRKALGLCTYCEGKGHLVATCPTRIANEEAKARRATSVAANAASAKPEASKN